jgi:hypothetical protein
MVRTWDKAGAFIDYAALIKSLLMRIKLFGLAMFIESIHWII